MMRAEATSYGRRTDALIAMSRDAGATMAERALAASHAARALAAAGVDYLTVYPLGLPEAPYDYSADDAERRRIEHNAIIARYGRAWADA